MTGHRDLEHYSIEFVADEISEDSVEVDISPKIKRPPLFRRGGNKLRRTFRRSYLVRLKTRVVNRLLAPLVVRVARTVAARDLDPLDDLVGDVKALRAQVDSLWPSVAQVKRSGREAKRVANRNEQVLETVGSLEVNQELFKAELASVHSVIEGFGRAISPGEGIAGAPRQFAELRQQLNALDRRVRLASVSGATDQPMQDAGLGVAHPQKFQPSQFDYVGFEHRFRGDSEEIANRTLERYPELRRGKGPVLDVGCGRGEVLAGLAEQGTEVIGVDLDPGMVAEACELGVDAHVDDAIKFLASVPEGTYETITAIQVVEHLELEYLVTFLGLVCTRLKPGGVFIAETPNPTSLIVLSRSYILDPTHVWPLHPSLMTFLCERAGFMSVEERFFSPAEEMYLELLQETPESPEMITTINRSLSQLNNILFGPQDYAVVATRE